MNLKDFKFQELNKVEQIFSVVKTDKTLLAEAKKRGFYYGKTKWNDLFNELFFNGGHVEFKDGLDVEFKSKAWTYCKAFM